MNTHKPRYLLIFLTITIFAIIAVFSLKTKQESNTKRTFSKQWQSQTPLTYPRRALAATTYNGYIYVVGGIDANGRYVRAVEYTKINPDGTLAHWQEASLLNEGRFYLAATASKGYLYAIGGAKGLLGENNLPVSTVEKAKINADGSLGKWTQTSQLTTPRRGLTVNQFNNRIYALGGYNGLFLHSIEHTTINANGSLNEWQRSPEQSRVDRYIHSSALANNNLYLLAGHMQNSRSVSYGDVEMSQILPDGDISPWQIEKTTLLTSRFIANAFSLGNYLYILAGHDGARRLNSVEFAPLDRHGHVGTWKTTALLTIPRSGAAAVTYKNRIYLLGGISQNGVLDSVEAAVQQTSDGHLGQFIINP